MNRLRNIVVGIDFSECSRCALEQAVRMARWNKSSLWVLHAFDPSMVDEASRALHLSPKQVENDLGRHANSRLQEWLLTVGSPNDTAVEVAFAPPIDLFLSAVRARTADLLVVGITGESIQTLGAGTLATKCLRKAPCKVLLVKQGHSRPIQKIVACIDFSETSRQVVIQALRVASQDLAEVHFLHVYQPRWRQWLSTSEPLPATADFETNYRELLKNNLRNFVNAHPGLNSVFAILEADTSGRGIAHYCQQVNADLVILGTKGKTNLNYVLLGSTVEKLLKEIPCSALLVRPLSQQDEQRIIGD